MVLVRGYGLSGLQTELLFLPCFAFLLLRGHLRCYVWLIDIYFFLYTFFLYSLYPFLLLVLSVCGQFSCDADVRRRLNGWEIFFALNWVLLSGCFLFVPSALLEYSRHMVSMDHGGSFSCLMLNDRTDHLIIYMCM